MRHYPHHQDRMTSPTDMAALRKLVKELYKLPPAPHAIMAHHSVPYGRCYRQWDTQGRMLIWANRGELAEPCRYAMLDQFGPLTFGIPIRNA